VEDLSLPQQKKDTRQNNFFKVCGKCKTSYSCCFGTRPPISRERRETIKKYLYERRIPVEEPFVKEDYVYPKENKNGYCIFHDPETKKCLIHPAKPETCVAGPITFDIDARKGRIEWYVKTETICPLAAVVHGNKKLLQKHLQAAKKEISRLVMELDSQELRAILKKEEPETFKIDEDGVEKEVLDKLRSK
jgi:hypothetical protein